MPSIRIRAAGPDDAHILSRLGWRTFLDTFVEGFGIAYSAADLAAFHAASYAPSCFARTIADPDSHVWIAERDGAAVGFAVVGPAGLPHPEVRDGDGELKRLYVRADLKGAGLAARLMDEALTRLERDGPRTLWLGVWSGNLRARRFYARYGFAKAGEYDFRVGETIDREFIMRRSPRPDRLSP